MKLNLFICVGLLAALASCAKTPTPVFHSGQFVESVISQQKGQIIYANCIPGETSCYYTVRFSNLTIGYAMKEFELKEDNK